MSLADLFAPPKPPRPVGARIVRLDDDDWPLPRVRTPRRKADSGLRKAKPAKRAKRENKPVVLTEAQIERRREKERERYRRNREKVLAYNRAWRARNKEKLKAQRRVRYLRQVELVREKGRAYYHAHREACLEKNRTWRAENLARDSARKRAYYLANKETINARRRALYAEKKAQEAGR